MLVLAVDLHEEVAQALEQRYRGGRVVDEDAMPPRSLELPLHNELPVGRRVPRLVQRRGHGACRGDVEDRHNRGGLGAGAYEIGLGAGAADQQQRVDDDGFAGAGLAGEDVETRCEDDARFLQDRQVPDRELSQHRGRYATTRG